MSDNKIIIKEKEETKWLNKFAETGEDTTLAATANSMRQCSAHLGIVGSPMFLPATLQLALLFGEGHTVKSFRQILMSSRNAQPTPELQFIIFCEQRFGSNLDLLVGRALVSELIKVKFVAEDVKFDVNQDKTLICTSVEYRKEYFTGTWKNTSVTVIVPQARLRELEAFETEAKVGMQIIDPYVMHIHGHGMTKDKQPFIVMENMKHFLDCKLIRKEDSYPSKLKNMYACAKGVYALHKHNLNHGDLIPESFIVTPYGIKLYYFGSPDDGKDSNTTRADGLKICYISPQRHRNKGRERSDDIYSLAVIFFNMMSDFFDEVDNDEILKMVHQSKRPEFPADFPKGLSQLISKMWSEAREDRPTCDIVLGELYALF
jgi:serine/threonine protein kinase